MQAVRAKTIIQAPGQIIDNGILIYHLNKVIACGPWKEYSRHFSGPVEDLGPVTIGPQIFNMHTHLEMSTLKDKAARGQGYLAWVKSLMALGRTATANPQEQLKENIAALDKSIVGLKEHGTGWVLDIASRLPAIVSQALEKSGIKYTLGIEFYGFNKNKKGLQWPGQLAGLTGSQWLAVIAAGHALYTTQASVLHQAKQWGTYQGRLFSLHLAEHSGEVEALTTGKGDFVDLLLSQQPGNFRGVKHPRCRPVEYADKLKLLDKSTLAVNCVHITKKDIDILARRGVAICLCPRCSEFIGMDQAPWEKLRDAGIILCLGTDSLASNTDLNVWNEAVYMVKKSNGAISAQDTFDWLTRSPAKVLGVSHAYGTLEKHKYADYSIVPEFLAERLQKGRP